MFFDRSPRTVRCTDGGRRSSKVGSSLRIASVTSIVLLPGCRITDRLIARCPPCFVYSHEAFRLFSTSSITFAMRDSRTGAPSRYATTSGLNAAAFMSWPLALMLNVRFGPYSSPVGRLTFQF